MSKETQIVCKNIFKNADKETIKAEYNKKWIKLINLLEKQKDNISNL